MKITSAKFIASAFTLDQRPGRKMPEIALVGSSNVGKSSLINQICRTPGMAKTSSTPGKTASLNYYRINDSFYFVDLPGYGYAKVNAATKAAWGELVDGYLDENPQLVGVLHIVDPRHDPKPNDVGFNRWLNETGMPFIVVASKADKLTKTEQAVQTEKFCSILGISPDEFLLFSATTGQGKDVLARLIDERILSHAPAPEPDEVVAPVGDTEEDEERIVW